MTQDQRADEPAPAFAQVELGGMAVGIPAAYVLHALARPPGLARLPRRGAMLEGVFSHRGRVVPLLDLRRWTGAPSAGVPPHVVVLGAHGRTIGLAVDAIGALVRLPASRIRKVHHDDAPESFFHSVGTLDDGSSLLSLLDPLRLMAQVQAWAQQDGCDLDEEAAPPRSAQRDAGAAAPLFALVRIAGSVVAVRACHVGEVVSAPPVQPLDLGASPVTGMMPWRGAQLPVLASGAALGLGGRAPARGPAVVLADGGRCVALPVDEVVAMRAIDPQTIEPCADAGMAAGGFFGGLARGADGAIAFVLDAAALLAAFAVPAMAGDDAGVALQRGEARVQPYIAFDIGQDWAIAMDKVLEIVSVPDDLARAAGADDRVIGNLNWHGRTLPVLDARRGRPVRADAKARLLVVRHQGRDAALLVNDLVALLPTQAGSESHFMLGGRERVRMVTVGRQAARTSYRVLELDTLPFFATRCAAGVSPEGTTAAA